MASLASGEEAEPAQEATPGAGGPAEDAAGAAQPPNGAAPAAPEPAAAAAGAGDEAAAGKAPADGTAPGWPGKARQTAEEAVARARMQRLQEMKKKQYLGKFTQKSMARKGLLNWPEGGWLDRMDKGLSSRIFRLEFAIPLEIGLSCTTFWFGVLVYVLCIIPVTFVSTAPETSWRFALVVCGPWTGLMVGFWPRRCISSSIGGSSVAKKLLEFKPGMVMAGPHLCMAAAWYAGAPGKAAAALFLCSYYLTTTVVALLHGLVWRRRPLASGIGQDVKRYDRSLQDAAIALHSDMLVNQSFPSAYTAIAAVWSTAFLISVPRLLGVPVAAAVLLSSAFGNVYFRLHHLLDVVAGEVVGAAVTVFLSRFGQMGWGLVLLFQLGQLAALKVIHKHLWPLAPENPRKQSTIALQLVQEKLS